MKKIFLLVAVICFLSACKPEQAMPIASVDCEAAWKQEQTDFASDLKFSITLEKSQYKVDEPIIPTLILKNVDTYSFWVNKRMVVNRPSLEEGGEVYFVIIAPWGETAEFIAMVDVFESLCTKDFVFLDPNQAIETQSDGIMSYGFISVLEHADSKNDPSGKYCVWAIYHNQADPGLDGPVWKGKIKSNFVEFEIVK